MSSAKGSSSGTAWSCEVIIPFASGWDGDSRPLTHSRFVLNNDVGTDGECKNEVCVWLHD